MYKIIKVRESKKTCQLMQNCFLCKKFRNTADHWFLDKLLIDKDHVVCTVPKNCGGYKNRICIKNIYVNVDVLYSFCA